MKYIFYLFLSFVETIVLLESCTIFLQIYNVRLQIYNLQQISVYPSWHCVFFFFVEVTKPKQDEKKEHSIKSVCIATMNCIRNRSTGGIVFCAGAAVQEAIFICEHCLELFFINKNVCFLFPLDFPRCVYTSN